MTRISKEWRFYRFFGASLVKRFSDTRYQALATYGIIDIWRKALRFLTPFPHGVMAAHGSLEPFVLVRVQVGELEGDMRRHVIMPPHIFYQIRSAVLSIIRFPRRRTSHRHMEPVPDGLSNISPLAKRMRCSSVTLAVAVMPAYRLSSMSPLARIPRLQIKIDGILFARASVHIPIAWKPA